jgi:hypothetical protein
VNPAIAGETASVPRSGVAVSPKTRTSALSDTLSHNLLRWFAPLAVAATVVFLGTFAERRVREHGPGWLVANMAGTPRVGAEPVEREATFRVGQWLETDHASRAKVSVGSIGEVSVDPNSRLRLVGMAEKNHRLELARGSMSAFIWAPPRLFFVDTPSATAVDLGCAYTLTVDGDGNSELEVTIGYVALQHGRRESIIRMGMKCITRRGAGPGTPYMIDAPDALRAALTRFDFERGGSVALKDILDNARAADAITLWHLLGRTDGSARAQVFDTLAKLSPPPVGITRAGILAGNTTMRHAWATALGLGAFATR